jgi:Winged helix DNA-binding domain
MRMQRIGTDERRTRVALRHGLVRRPRSVDGAAAAVVGLHASDPTTVFLSARARVDGFVPPDLEDALYARRSLVRMIGMRRTLFVVPRDLAGTMDEACAKALAPPERRRLIGMLEAQGVARPGRGARWLDRVAAATLAALEARGEASARQLTSDVPELATKLSFGEGKTWGGTVGVSTRVLFLLATEGRIVRARPLGTWVSGQYRWTTTERWLGGPLDTVERADACAELLRRWLRAFGPGTLTDIRWWTGWTAKIARSTLEALGVVEVELDDGTGYVLQDDLGPSDDAGPWVALLPGLDPTVMAWKERGWYLGDHAPLLFDPNGNAGPTVWVNGRIVGGWMHAPDGEVVVELLDRVDARSRRLIETERAELADWLGDARIRARFPGPIERRLLAT